MKRQNKHLRINRAIIAEQKAILRLSLVKDFKKVRQNCPKIKVNTIWQFLTTINYTTVGELLPKIMLTKVVKTSIEFLGMINFYSQVT